VWDIFPYPSRDVINMVFTDIDGIAMATAQPEKNNDYILDDDVPIVWYFTDTRISNQRTIIMDAIAEVQEMMGDIKINIIWQPMNGKRFETFYKRDGTEVADTLMKIKKVSYTSKSPVRVALAKSWYPSGADKHSKALSISRLNLALEVISYYWFRCRCIDISDITMVPRTSSADGIQEEVSDEERTNLRGYEDKKFKALNYRDARRFPMEISYYPARRSREIFRKIIQVYGLEPNWEKARNSRDNYWRIDIPAIYTDGKLEILHAPLSGERAYLAMRSRIISWVQYEEEKEYSARLPSTFLEDYEWEFLNAQSLDGSRSLETDIVEYTLSVDNNILQPTIPRPQFTEQGDRREREEESGSRSRSRSRCRSRLETRSALDRLGPKITTGESLSEEDKEANQSIEQEFMLDPCPVENMELGGTPSSRAAPVEPEPTKRARSESTGSGESLKSEEESDESSEDSEVSSSSDEEDRKKRRVTALIDFLDRYDETEENRRRKRRKLRKKMEKLKATKRAEKKKK